VECVLVKYHHISAPHPHSGQKGEKQSQTSQKPVVDIHKGMV